jgi:hypothetical protein
MVVGAVSSYVEQVAAWVIDTPHAVYEDEVAAALEARASASKVHGAATVAVQRGWLIWAGRENGRRVVDAAEGMR